MTKVKICGITNAEDAHNAVALGADALGFIFAEASPRFISPTDAREIVRTLPPFITTVGVFVNSSTEKINRTLQLSGIQCVQLHGDETPEDAARLQVPVYKAFRVDDGFDVAAMKPYRCTAYLLDAYVDGLRGGTGKTFNWQVAKQAKNAGRIILSGGLKPDNVKDAIRQVQPYAIDVNSGVELSPGRKDKRKLEELFTVLRTMQESVC